MLAALPERSQSCYVQFDLNHEIEGIHCDDIGKSDVQLVVSRFMERNERLLLPQPNIFVRDFYRNKVLAQQTR